MNTSLFISGILCFILGLTHSIMGELLIFRYKKKANKIVPTIVKAYLKQRHLRIIWVTWHLVSFFGWCIAAILIKIACQQSAFDLEIVNFIIYSITITMFSSSFLVIFGTRGKHPGWVVLLIIGIITITQTIK